MTILRSLTLLLAACALAAGFGRDFFAIAEGLHVLPEGRLPSDSRLGPLKDLDGYFPLNVPRTGVLLPLDRQVARGGRPVAHAGKNTAERCHPWLCRAR